MTGNELIDVNEIIVFFVGHHKQFIFILNKMELHRRVLSRGVS